MQYELVIFVWFDCIEYYEVWFIEWRWCVVVGGNVWCELGYDVGGQWKSGVIGFGFECVQCVLGVCDQVVGVMQCSMDMLVMC